MNLYYRYALVVLWMLVIFMFSAQVADTSSAQSAVVVEAVKSLNVGLSDDILTFVTRKAAHITAYFILGVLLYNVLRYYAVNWRLVLVGIVIAGSYAVSDEYHQTFVPGRSGEVRDVLIDTAAASAGIGLFYLYLNRRKGDTIT